MPQSPQSTPVVELHGWDPTANSWHGPDEIEYSLSGCQGIVSRLRTAAGTWYGRLRTQALGCPALSFWATVRDLDDAGLATLDLEGSHGGPMQTILIVPAQRRREMRSDLAFEFVSYLRFLEGKESVGSEMAIHDYVERILSEADTGTTLVFSVESRFALAETRIAMCEQSERLVSSMVAWLAERDASRIETALTA